MPQQTVSDVLIAIFEKSENAKEIGVILEQSDGAMRFHCSTDVLHKQLGLTAFACLGVIAQVMRGWGRSEDDSE